jgi:hypothetical protein
MKRIACTLLLSITLSAAEGWPPLPDPIGLGPRLVTLEWLREHRQAMPAGATDADVQAAYWRLQPRSPTMTTVDEQAIEADERARLLYLLRRDHQLTPAADTPVPDLRRQLAAARLAQQNKDTNAAAAAATDGRSRITVEESKQPREQSKPAPAPAETLNIDPEARRRMVHMEVVGGRNTVTVYRYNDGGATAVIDDWRGAKDQLQRVDLPAPPNTDTGWAICASDMNLSVYHKPGLLLWHNRTDQELQLDIDHEHGAIVPARSWRISIGPASVNLIQHRPTIHQQKPDWQTLGGDAIKCVWIGVVTGR